MIEWAKLFVTIIAGLAAAYWAFFKWTDEQEKNRQARERQLAKERQDREREQQAREDRFAEERKRLATLYVTPFLLACENLQSRLYNILKKGGYGPLKKRYPENDYAEETLYLIAQYFAWEYCIYRYTQYARDQQIIRLTEWIHQIFATDSLGVGAFCFFRSQQRDLGQLVRARAVGPFGGEFDTISFRDFKELLSSQLSKSKAIQDTLCVLKEASSMEELVQRDKDKHNISKVDLRLASVQKHLVELLRHLECKEGITFFFIDGNKASRLTASEGTSISAPSPKK